MLQTWRWFGPDDPVDPADMVQAGVQGVVSALYHIRPGQVWPLEDIRVQQDILAEHGLNWAVVESLPVSEAIKTQSGDWRAHLDAYRLSLANLSEAGIGTVCYNFMPVLDWTRTDLRAPMPHGGHAMAFDLVAFAAFDLHILARDGAQDDFPPEVVEAAGAYFAGLPEGARTDLARTIVSGLPGANDSWTLDQVRELLALYDRIDADRLRRHMFDFLAEVIPTAQALDMRMCAHPDDPPFGLLGLPRILSSIEDYALLVSAVDAPANGITFCTGSLGVDAGFDPVDFIKTLGGHIHFAHLRNTTRRGATAQGQCSFFEAAHLEGDTDMVATLRALLAEEGLRRSAGRADAVIPFRPDHGQAILSDLKTTSLPGYPLIGRMRGLAELRGVIAGLGGAI
ncbi:MAG: mannonate dehydratase [Sedimentitalea sp.]